MTQDELLDELADILNADRATLSPQTPLDTVTWDSMALLAYLALIRFRFGKLLPGVSCKDFRTVADLLAPASNP